jgi:hypothetical protein
MAALHDWDALLKQYSIDYEAEPVSPAEWCTRIGISYSSAKRYITVKAAKNEIALRNSQAKKRTPKPGRDEKGHFLKGHQIPECVNQNLDNLTPFQPGNQAARTHGGYSRLIRAEDLAIGDESELDGLIAERRMFRARIASALRTIQEAEDELEKPGTKDDPERLISINRLIAAANKAIDNSAIRVESLTKTISSIRIDDVNVPRLKADHLKIEAQTEKLKAETDKLGRKSTAESVTFQLDW